METTAALAQALTEVCRSIAIWATANNGAEEIVIPDQLKPENLPVIQAQLKKLLTLLQENNPGPTQVLLEKLEIFLGREAIAGINAHLLDYNFRAAEAICQRLLAELS